MSITSTTLRHASVLAKIDVALRHTVIEKWSVDHVANRRGRNFLAVRYRPSTKRVCKPFVFLDRDGRDVSDVVYRALRQS